MRPPVHTAVPACALATLVAALVATAPASGSTRAVTPPQLSAALDAWTAANPATSALVWRLDPAGPVEVLSYRADVARRPASTMKIVTAASALLALGPSFRFQTRLYAGASATQTGDALKGALYVKGYGDPVLSTPQYARRYLDGYGGNIGRFGRILRDRGVRSVRGPLVVDDSAFDRLRRVPAWPARYANECQPLAALSVNQAYLGNVRGRYVRRPATAAGVQIRNAMRSLGVRHAGGVIVGRTPAQARLLGTVSSPPLRVITRLMLPDSDNYLAEMMTKGVGATVRGEGTTRAGTAHARAQLAAKGLLDPSDRLVDGSGLAVENRLTATTLVEVLAAADREPAWGATLLGALPRGGEGTLIRRLRGLGPRVRAKTGYISGTSTLAGVVDSRAGTRYAFALLMNQGSISGAKAVQDRIVALLGAGIADTA